MSYPTLRSGMSGPAVAALQRALNQAGNTLGVDGSFGPATRAAVVNLQQRAGLAQDGVVGPATWSALEATLGTSLDIPTTGLSGGAEGSGPLPPPAPAQGTNWATVAKAVLGLAAVLGLGAVAVGKATKASGKGAKHKAK